MGNFFFTTKWILNEFNDFNENLFMLDHRVETLVFPIASRHFKTRPTGHFSIAHKFLVSFYIPQTFSSSLAFASCSFSSCKSKNLGDAHQKKKQHRKESNENESEK